MRSALESTSPTNIIDFEDNGYHWRATAGLAELLRSSPIDWFNLQAHENAVLVKRNSHRDVWHVSFGGKAYFAKVYHPHDAVRRAKLLLRGPTAVREWEVGHYAASQSVATVAPVATALKGFRGTGGPSLLITEAVPDVKPLNEYWLEIRQDRHQSNLLTESLAMLIARAHQCGFQHGDMHPGNILVRPVGRRGEALFVDLHNVRTGNSVSLREVIANLAQLNQWFRRHSTLSQRRRFLKYYFTYRDRYAQASEYARNYTFDPQKLVAQLSVRAEKHANALWAKRDRRTRRTGRYFAQIRPAPGWRGHAMLKSKHPPPMAHASKLSYSKKQWEAWLADPMSWVDPNKHELIKDSHTATICKAMLPAEPNPVTVIVKRHLARNPWKRLGQLLGPSRSMRAWRTANMLLNRDLPVAQPLVVMEHYALGLARTDSMSFTDFIPDSVDLETFMTRDIAAIPAERQRRVKDHLLTSTVRLLKMFHDRGFVHRDLKAPNLLVNWSPPYEGFPVLTFIDMDGIRHVRRSSPKQRTRAIVRLCVSLLGSPACTCSDRLRFLKSYLTGPGRTPARWKAIWREIHEQVCQKQRDKDHRRQWKLAHYGRE